MKHIWLEKESIYRSIADFLFGIVMGAVSVLCLFGENKMLCVMFAVFTVLLFFSGIQEFKTDIAYDSERMYVRNIFSRSSIAYTDIQKIERIYVRTLKFGHWRWYVTTAGGKITVPFPDSTENTALLDLLDCIKKANPSVQYKWNANSL